MTRLEVLALALALAADAFSVGAVVGLTHHSARQVFRLAYHFGLFQSLFTLVGALIGTLLLSFIQAWDHWIVFSVLALLGVRMITGVFESKDGGKKMSDLTRGLPLIGLSLAVSIDALGAGIGLPAAKAPLVWSVVMIGVVTSLATFVAMLLAEKIRARAGRKIEVFAGIALILLGVRFLLADILG